MPKIMLLRGLPGSGKSTYARKLVEEQGYVRVNKDELREMLNNGKHSQSKEMLVLEIRDSIIEHTIKSGRNVVVDDTNIHPKHERTIQAVANIVKADLIINDSFMSVPIETCIENDLKRLNSVGEK